MSHLCLYRLDSLFLVLFISHWASWKLTQTFETIGNMKFLAVFAILAVVVLAIAQVGECQAAFGIAAARKFLQFGGKLVCKAKPTIKPCVLAKQFGLI